MKKAAMLFSGGIDSTYVAMRMAPDFDKLILITYKVPGMANVEFSRRTSGQLEKIYGDKIEHNIIDITNFTHSVRGGIFASIEDNIKYGFHYSWCLGCKTAMHLYTIKYCKKNDIPLVLDGSNNYDIHALEQYREVKDLFVQYYKIYGLKYTSPFYYEEDLDTSNSLGSKILSHLSLYKPQTENRAIFLKTKGFDLGKGLGSQYRKTQPSCVTSVFFNSARLLLKLIKKEKEENYLRYVSDKVQRVTIKKDVA